MLEHDLEIEELGRTLDELKYLNSSISIDSFNLSISTHYRAKIKSIFTKNNVIFSYRNNYQTIFRLNNYKITTQATTKNIIITFKGITSYKAIQRKHIFQLIKELSFIPNTNVHRIDICFDFYYNHSFKKHLSKKDIYFYHNSKQLFEVKEYKFMKTAPDNEVEEYLFYLNNLKFFSNDEDNTTYLHHKRNRENAKYKSTRGLGKEYFSSYYYDKQVKAKSKGYKIPFGVVRLEYSFGNKILDLLDIHSPRELYKKLPSILDKLNNSIDVIHTPSNTQLCWCKIHEDREFLKLLSYFWKESTKLPSYIEKQDNHNIVFISMLQDVERGLTNIEISKKDGFSNEKRITKLRLI